MSRPFPISKIAIPLVAFSLALALTEGLAERFIPPALSVQYSVWPPFYFRSFQIPDGLLPGISGHLEVHANSQGIRGREFSGTDTYRILSIGGSTTECIYLGDDFAWPSKLQRGLAASGHGSWWVGNVGISGRRISQFVLDVNLLLPQYPKIDAVVVLPGINDLIAALAHPTETGGEIPPEETEPALIARSYRQDRTPSGLRWSALARLACNSLAEWWERMRLERRGIVLDAHGEGLARAQRAAGLRDLPLPDLKDALGTYGRALRDLIHASRRQHVRLILATQPYLWRNDLNASEERLLWMGIRDDHGKKRYYTVNAMREGMDRFNELLRFVARSEGIEVVDLAREIPHSTEAFFDDVHFNRRGAELVAAQFLKAFVPGR